MDDDYDDDENRFGIISLNANVTYEIAYAETFGAHIICIYQYYCAEEGADIALNLCARSLRNFAGCVLRICADVYGLGAIMVCSKRVDRRLR